MAEPPPRLLPFVRQVAPVFRQYPEIVAVYLFGSVARQDEAPPGSDLDLGLLLTGVDPHGDCHRLLGDLTARLEALTPRPIDLVVLGSQGPVFCHEVLLEGFLIYENEAGRERRIDFESDTIIRALDFRSTLELARRGYRDGYRSVPSSHPSVYLRLANLARLQGQEYEELEHL